MFGACESSHVMEGASWRRGAGSPVRRRWGSVLAFVYRPVCTTRVGSGVNAPPAGRERVWGLAFAAHHTPTDTRITQK